MSHFPSTEDYAAEPIRFPPLTVINVVAEEVAVTVDYRNQSSVASTPTASGWLS